MLTFFQVYPRCSQQNDIRIIMLSLIFYNMIVLVIYSARLLRCFDILWNDSRFWQLLSYSFPFKRKFHLAITLFYHVVKFKYIIHVCYNYVFRSWQKVHHLNLNWMFFHVCKTPSFLLMWSKIITHFSKGAINRSIDLFYFRFPILCFFDLKQAFNTVWRKGPRYKLLDNRMGESDKWRK